MPSFTSTLPFPARNTGLRPGCQHPPTDYESGSTGSGAVPSVAGEVGTCLAYAIPSAGTEPSVAMTI